MAYIVTNTRGQIIAVVQDGTVDITSTSQTLIGKNVTPFGQYAVENLVHQLENFANSTPPGNPISGQLWYNTTEEKAYAYSGQEWKPVSGLQVAEAEPTADPRIGDLWFNPTTQQLEIYTALVSGNGWIPVSKVLVSAAAPSGNVAGELYYNTTSKQLYAFDGTVWNLIGPEAVSGFGTTRWQSTTLLDTLDQSHAVMLGTVNGVVTSIVASQTFVIREDQRPTGFSNIVPGINMASGSVLSGRATFADQLTTARTINNVAFDGSQNITIPNNGDLIAGDYILGDDYAGTVPVTWAVDATSNNTANKVVARDGNGDFSARIITADLDGNVTGTATNVTGTVTSSHGGTGYTSYVPGQILLGASNGSLIAGNITGSNYISVSKNDSGFQLSYTGGAGNGSVTSVGLLAGSGINIDGGPITSSGNITINNTGVTRLNAGYGMVVNRVNGEVTVTNAGVVNIAAGTGISVSSGNVGTFLVNNTGVTEIVAGSGIAINQSKGTVTISNTGGGGGGGGSGGYAGWAGAIQMWAGEATPIGWHECDGSAVSRTQYSQLFSRIGTTYGSGDGSTTFNLPDMRGKLGMGVYQGRFARNEQGWLALQSYPLMDFTNPDDLEIQTAQQSGDAKEVQEISIDTYTKFGGSTWPGADSGTSPAPLSNPGNGEVYVAVFGYPKGRESFSNYRRTLTMRQMVNVSGTTSLRYYVNRGTEAGWGENIDSGEGIKLQYSLYDGGVTGSTSSWVDLDVVPTSITPNTWISRTVTLPSAILSNPSHVKFRFVQEGSYSAQNGGYVDTWAITSLRAENGALNPATLAVNRLVNNLGGSFNGREGIKYFGAYWIICMQDQNASASSGVTKLLAGTGGVTLTPSDGVGTVTINAGDMSLSAIQTVSGRKTFTGGIVSQAYNMTLTGNSMFYVDTPAKAVQIAVDNTFPFLFYTRRLLVEGNGETLTGEKTGGAAIVGLDSSTNGSAGVAGIHTQARPGLGQGVAAASTNNSFTGCNFQTLAVRAASDNYLHMRCYSGNEYNPVFTVNGVGDVRADGTYTSPASDYAEFFEWADGNPNNEDRRGRTVTMVGNKIRLAKAGDDVIGVVSSQPGIIGDAAELAWTGKYLRDQWGVVVQEPYHVMEWTDSDGKDVTVASYDITADTVIPDSAVRRDRDGLGNALTRNKPNPDYDPNVEYVPRSRRPEWSPIGLVGKLRVLKGEPVDSRWIKMRELDADLDEWLVR